MPKGFVSSKSNMFKLTPETDEALRIIQGQFGESGDSVADALWRFMTENHPDIVEQVNESLDLKKQLSQIYAKREKHVNAT